MIDIEKCRITHYPAGVLAKQASTVEKIDDNIRRLVEKMIGSAADWCVAAAIYHIACWK
jgi:peptide deformylase